MPFEIFLQGFLLFIFFQCPNKGIYLYYENKDIHRYSMDNVHIKEYN